MSDTVEAAVARGLRCNTEAVRCTMILEDQGLDDYEFAAQERVLLDELIDSHDLWRASPNPNGRHSRLMADAYLHGCACHRSGGVVST